MAGTWWGHGLLLGLLAAQHVLGLGEAPDGDEEVVATPTKSKTLKAANAAAPEGRCSSTDDGRECPPEAASTQPSDLGEHLAGRVHPHDEGVVAETGFLYARSLSLSVDAEEPGAPASATTPSTVAAVSPSARGRTLRNRVLGQSWCSAGQCPVSAALTLSNTTARHNGRKVGQGEAVVACLDCTFSAASVSIVDGEAVCASACATSNPRGVCAAVCQVDGVDCVCSAGCSGAEPAADSLHAYAYQVTAATGVRDLLSHLHRLMVRVHGAAEHLNMTAALDVPGRSRLVRSNIEKRFGKEKAKAVPLVFPSGSGSAMPMAA